MDAEVLLINQDLEMRAVYGDSEAKEIPLLCCSWPITDDRHNLGMFPCFDLYQHICELLISKSVQKEERQGKFPAGLWTCVAWTKTKNNNNNNLCTL